MGVSMASLRQMIFVLLWSAPTSERVDLPASGLSVLLCRPPVFAALAMGRAGTQLQAKITDAKPEEIKTEDIEAFTQWLNGTLTRLFVQPRFAAAPEADEIGLADILIEDLKFIFRWLRGEVFSTGNREQGTGDRDETSVTCNLSTCQPLLKTSADFLEDKERLLYLAGSGEAQPLPSERTSGAHGDAGVPAGLLRG